MKKKAAYAIILPAYCIPYVFLAMYGDAQARTMLLYALMTAVMGLLCFGCIKAKSILALIMGNMLSCASSCIFTYNIRIEKWAWYFKPFSAPSLAVIISLIALAVQIVVWKCAAKGISGSTGKHTAHEKEN